MSSVSYKRNAWQGCVAGGWAAPTVAMVEMTRRRPRRDSGCIVRSSVCFQITPASSSCRHTAFLISNGSPAQAPASLQCYSLNLQRACKHVADRQSRSLQAKKQDGKGTGEPISIVVSMPHPCCWPSGRQSSECCPGSRILQSTHSRSKS